MMQEFNVNSKPVAHMVAQIRAKQLAIHDSQYNTQKSIVEKWEEHQTDISGEALCKQIVQNLEKFYNISKSTNDYLKTQDINSIGFPIKHNKTDLQLKMAYKYAKEQEDNLIEQIKNGKFYNSLSNNIDSEKLPVLQSNSNESYWGNDNSSVNTILLESISVIIWAKPKSLVGAALLYPFYNHEYSFPENLVPEDYPFAGENDIQLFGDYQFGGHRYFKEQLIFGAEDCSSSVGKATYLTTKQIKDISTTQMRENYSNYGYELVTTLNDIDQKQLELIKPGDIYIYKSHTAIIATKPDNYSNITTLQFARDIDREDNKLLGSGLYDYNLSKQLKENLNVPILRAKELEPLREEFSLPNFLNIVDKKYAELYPEGPAKDIIGDCSIFFENNVV